MKRVLLQGSTGSIGLSAMSVIEEQRDSFNTVGLAAGRKEEELLEQARVIRPASLALLAVRDAKQFAQRARELGVHRVYTGEDAFRLQAENEEYDVLLNAVMGAAGIQPTIAALKRSINVALANKETLVAAGEIVMECARANQAMVLPIDSEHSALQQCMIGERREDVRTLWLTTSGGPFWNKTREELDEVTPQDALAHPTWAMGPKITIDSATLFNKGLEVIEACRLFAWPVKRINVVRQKESVIHSMIEFVDGSFKAQLSVPDMRLPILYALTYPNRAESNAVATKPGDLKALHFEDVHIETFPCLRTAFQAAAAGGTAPAILSAADEIAVHAFLKGEIKFPQIAEIIDQTLDSVKCVAADSLESVLEADKEARNSATQTIKMMPARIC